MQGEKIKKSEAEWRRELSPEQYAVLRQQATERPFTGKYVNSKAAGIYACAACGQELFSSATKYNSMSGWPSFWDVVDDGNVGCARTAATACGASRWSATAAIRIWGMSSMMARATRPACAIASIPARLI